MIAVTKVRGHSREGRFEEVCRKGTGHRGRVREEKRAKARKSRNMTRRSLAVKRRRRASAANYLLLSEGRRV